METGRLKTEFYILKCYQIFHLILIVLILACHIITHTQYLFIYTSLLVCYIVGLCLYLVIFSNSLVSNIIIFRKKYTPTTINNLKNILKNIAVLCIIKGIILAVAYWFNYLNYDSFITNCPFSFSLEKMTDLINNSKSSKVKDMCQLKRCLFKNEYIADDKDISNNQIKAYNYICNFNAHNSFIHNKNNDLYCAYIIRYDISNHYNQEKLSYLSKCYEYNEFYLCSTKEKRHDKFKLSVDLNCPNNFKKYRIIILGFLFPLIDIGADLVVILFTFCQYNIIIKLINLRNIIGGRFTASSLNSTKDNSIIDNSNDNDINILPQLNIMQTEVYISQNLMEYNTNFKNDKETKEKKEIKELDLSLNKKELSESKNELINSKNELINLEGDKINKNN